MSITAVWFCIYLPLAATMTANNESRLLTEFGMDYNAGDYRAGALAAWRTKVIHFVFSSPPLYEFEVQA